MYFSNAVRPDVKGENPDMKITEMSKVIGERWKALGAEDKAKYEQMAKSDKARYEDEMRAYKKKNLEEGRQLEAAEEEEAYDDE